MPLQVCVRSAPAPAGPAARMAVTGRRAGPVALALLLALSLPACGSGGNGPSAAEEPQDPAAETAAAAESEPAAPDESAAGPPGSGIATGRPYLVILFPGGGVDYEEQLAAAMRQAQARKPGFALDMAAVAPSAASPETLKDNAAQARARAAQVMDSLAALGIGRDRVHLVSYTISKSDAIEIRLYIR